MQLVDLWFDIFGTPFMGVIHKLALNLKDVRSLGGQKLPGLFQDHLDGCFQFFGLVEDSQTLQHQLFPFGFIL